MATGFPPESLRPILKEVAELLKERKETVSVAETAAGGLISACLVSYPGASAFFKGGLTLYTLPSRLKFGGWTEDNLKNYSGPTGDIVLGLADHARTTLDSTYGLSESGTAGPTGGTTRNRMPGFVALAVSCGAPQGTRVREMEGLGVDREGNMVRFAEEGLTLLRDVIRDRASL